MSGNRAYSNAATNNQRHGIDTGEGGHLLQGNLAIDDDQSGGGFTNIKLCPILNPCSSFANQAP